MTTSAARPCRRAGAEPGELAGVAADHLGSAGGAASLSVCESGKMGPAGLVFHAEPVAAEVDRFDEGGADAAHRVGDQVPGFGCSG